MTKQYYFYEFEIGRLAICSENNCITDICLADSFNIKNCDFFESETIKEAAKELKAYFNKKLITFSVPIKLNGTDFQKKVWQELTKIPYGQTRSYKEISISINNDLAFRAVGNACNKNPILIMVPCHRVIGSNKKMVGFACGINIKDNLLNLEK
ncbi:MAG: methylated-DNA--[protein]-cysteine S-methyltransferase [Candidatus Riflebacteria bacterium]|nr:methylated-DNA--[protein]-cysteine S-methyltransferase [Candidatus Riflebacteria bacterium]